MNESDNSNGPQSQFQSYLEFDLDGETMRLVEKLAAEESVTPFEMCAILLQETLQKG